MTTPVTNGETMAQLSIGMPKKMVDDLKAAAEREDRPVAYIVRRAVEVYLAHFAGTSGARQ